MDNKSSLLEEECSSSLDEITKSLGLLEVNDSLFSPDEDSITSLSTQSDEPIPHSNAKHEKLNEFLVSCGIEPLERRWLKWNEASDRTKQRYIKKSSDIISSVLQTISTDNAGFIWQELISNSPAYARNLELTCYHLWKRVTWRHSLNHTTMPTAGRPEDKYCPSYLA